MNKNYKSKIIILSIFTLMGYISNASAAGIAGSDRTICKGDTITIGHDGGGGWVSGSSIDPYDCYRWESSQWMESPHNPQTRVWPQNTITYKLTRTSDDFSETEIAYITITVVDKINSITATPERCCWKKGEDITIDQFSVTTDPAGLGNLCDVSPAIVPPGLGFGEYQTEVTISNQCSAGSYAETKVNIDCADKDIASSYSPIGIDFTKLIEIINDVPETAKIFPCDPGSSVGGTFTITNFKECCPDRKGGYQPCIDPTMVKIAGEINYEFSVTCRYPFGVPYVAAAYLMGGFGAGGKIEASIASTCQPPAEVCIEFTPYGFLFGGLEFELGPGVIEASGILKGTLSIPALKYCNTSGLAVIGEEVCAQIDGEISVKLGSFLTKKVSHTFWKGCL